MYVPNKDRYQKMIYRRLGNSGLKLPVLSFGLWQNFGIDNDYNKAREMILKAFDNGITHFDLANNYGPPPGHAEELFGKIMKNDLSPYRDELIISTKAGYKMLDGPYQDGGSRKYLISSLDQSLKRLNLSYVDIFYHHRYDPETNLYETMLALRDIVLSGKALYIGLSNYNPKELKEAEKILKELKVPFVILQNSYSMLNRKLEEDDILNLQNSFGGGVICYSALSQGMLTNKYIGKIPKDARVYKKSSFWLKEDDITDELKDKLKQLDKIAQKRNQSIAQMALSWVLRNPLMTSSLISTSKISQLEENLKVIDKLNFTSGELKEIDNILK
ncbi:MAG: aldo/keto reductase [Acholeplasmataceae bacterium]